jgi:DNA-binding transcriptional LysR family regulator
MDRFHHMQVFVAVADTAGFAPAARKLRLSPPAVTRAIAGLEERLGVPLFHRTTRQVRLTAAGERFLEDCRRILAEIEEAEESAAGAHRQPRGRLMVTAPIRFGCMHVAPLLMEFLERYPEVSAQTLFVDRIVNLLEEGLDVAIRIGELPDSSLTAIPAGAVRRVICASPAYLEARGIPEVPADLRAHDTVLFSGLTPRAEWSFRGGDGHLTVPVSARLTVNTADVAICAASSGQGLTQLLSYMVAPELTAGRLKIVLADYETAPSPIHVVYQEGRKAAGRVRAFVDFMVDRLRTVASIREL